MLTEHWYLLAGWGCESVIAPNILFLEVQRRMLIKHEKRKTFSSFKK